MPAVGPFPNAPTEVRTEAARESAALLPRATTTQSRVDRASSPRKGHNILDSVGDDDHNRGHGGEPCLNSGSSVGLASYLRAKLGSAGLRCRQHHPNPAPIVDFYGSLLATSTGITKPTSLKSSCMKGPTDSDNMTPCCLTSGSLLRDALFGHVALSLKQALPVPVIFQLIRLRRWKLSGSTVVKNRLTTALAFTRGFSTIRWNSTGRNAGCCA